MKKIIFLLITFVAIIGCSSQKNERPQITFNDSAYIKLNVINCLDTAHLSYKTITMLPLRCVINQLDITHDGTYYFAHKATKPDLIDINFIKRIQTYVIPGDTLIIFANLAPGISEEESIRIDGIFGIISDFYTNKQKDLGYWDQSNRLTEYLNSRYSVAESITLSDSLFQSEIDFLNYYNKKNNLPDWFYQTMKAEIEYKRIYWGPYVIDYRKFFYGEKVINPEDYYTFNKTLFYNPKARFSRSYYDCIGHYSMINHENGLENARGINRALPLFERSIPEAKKILKGEILEYFLAYRMSELFEGSRAMSDLEKSDSLFNKIQDQFTNKEIVEILRQHRDVRIKYIKERLWVNPVRITECPVDKI